VSFSDEYDDLDLTLDAGTLAQTGIDHLEEQIPGWIASPANIETVLIEGIGQIAAELAESATIAPPEAMALMGQTIFGIPMQPGIEATGAATITFAVTTPAVTIPEGTEITVPSPGGEDILFVTDRDISAPAGGGSFPIMVIASEPGEDGNGCFGEGDMVEVVDGLETILVDPTDGGADPETPEDYLNRLTNLLSTLAPRPIIPRDFAIMASLVPGVGRVAVIDLYQPGTNDNQAPLVIEGTPVLAGAGASNVARCVSIIVTGEDGAAPSQSLMHSVWLALDAQREVNFQVYVVPPKYTTIDLIATVVAYPNFALADVKANAEATIAGWLSPLGWGAPGGLADDPLYIGDNKIRIYEAVDYLNRAAGVWYVSTVQTRVSGGSYAGTDLTLPGIAPLPLPGIITVTVNAPS